MKKRLNITLEEDIYFGLHQRLGQRRISQFIENLIRPHVIQEDLEAAYREMAADDEREQAALKYAENTIQDLDI